MANTQGFEAVAELTQAAVLDMLRAMSDSDLFKKNLNIPAGLPFGDYTTSGGWIQAPKEEMGVQMLPPDHLQLQFGLHIQVELANPPVPAAKNIDIDANVSVRVRIGKTADKKVAIFFGEIADADIDLTLPAGDPIAAQIHTFITNFVHDLYQADGPTFPHHKDDTQHILTFTLDTTVDLMDAAAPHDIQVSFPVMGVQEQLKVSIPLHLKMYNIQPMGSFLDPMGVEARIVLTTNLNENPGSVSADMSMAVVTVDNFGPAGSDYGNEGDNYTTNNNNYFHLLEGLLKTQIQQQGQSLVSQMAPIAFTYPLPDVIKAVLKVQLKGVLQGLGTFEVWPGTAAVPPQLQINDLGVIVLADALGIGLNPAGGANIAALANFVPVGMLFAIAISADKTRTIVNASIHAQFPNFPTIIHNVHGKDVKLKSLDFSLTSALHFSGDLTVIDAILGSIDVDAGYDVDVGLEWLPPAPNGTQLLKANPGDPDVHLSALAWLVSILLGFLSFGVIGVVIAIVVIEIVQGIASSIGGDLVRDQVTNAITGIGAWPSPLNQVGDVKSSFQNPIVISPEGLLFQG